MTHHVVMQEARKVFVMQSVGSEIKRGREGDIVRQKVVELLSRQKTSSELVKKSYWCSII